MFFNPRILTYFLLFTLLTSCKSGSFNLFKAASPHEQYKRKLISSGLDQTGMGAAWIETAARSLTTSLRITLPFRESGYFAAEKINARTYRFRAERGQAIQVRLSRRPVENFTLYLDLWMLRADQEPRHLASADSLGNPFSLEVNESTDYLIRLQPELLRSGNYTLEINAGPSLAYPLPSEAKTHIGSFWGDGRDQNTRKHEGIDIFAPFRTPVLAVSEGTVVRVNENNLGGKVVWMRPSHKSYSLYYAHLDEQLASAGQQVQPGDTLGLVGNTGNAKNTPSHLHFGVYAAEGAIDPLPFVDRDVRPLPKISAALELLNSPVRSRRNAQLYTAPNSDSPKRSLAPGQIMEVEAANRAWYTVTLPDGEKGFVQSTQVQAASTSLRSLHLGEAKPLYEHPDTSSVVKRQLDIGTRLEVLGNFGQEYLMVKISDAEVGWINSFQ